ncbi:MAG: hypothetical protein KKH22_12080 [Proteobacteria bacterium]|nr:hypothetical protein [Pseudomonadota bacterium]
MKAHLIEDIIHAVGTGDTEIGALPPGVGVERLRWDGATLIDLAAVTQIHVRHISGTHFELHAVAVAGSRPVAMTWADRRNLVVVDGLIRLKTAEELYADYVADYNGKLKAGLRQGLCKCIGDGGDQVADINKMIYLLTEAVCGDPLATAALQELVVEMRGTYSIDISKAKLTENAVALKALVPDYYAAKL